jgi:hypothetical protein
MKIASEIANMLRNAAKRLKGVDKRQFMAEAVNSLGTGAQRAAKRQMNWCRNTIAKGHNELRTGITCVNNYSTQGRKKAEELNPELIGHIKAIVEDQVQADPSMNSERLYLKITAPNVRKQLHSRFGYTEDMLPSVSTVGRKLNANGYHLKKVRKTLPLKKFLKQI